MPQVNAIPISLGGTGETTAEAARIALGIAAGGGAPGGATNTLQFNLGDGDFGGVPNSVVDPSTGDVTLGAGLTVNSTASIELIQNGADNSTGILIQAGATSGSIAIVSSSNSDEIGIETLGPAGITIDTTGSDFGGTGTGELYLISAGGILSEDNSANGISLLEISTGGIKLDATGQPVGTGTGPINLTSAGGVSITDTSSLGVVINEAGASTALTINGSAGNYGIQAFSLGQGNQLQTHGTGGAAFPVGAYNDAVLTDDTGSGTAFAVGSYMRSYLFGANVTGDDLYAALASWNENWTGGNPQQTVGIYFEPGLISDISFTPAERYGIYFTDISQAVPASVTNAAIRVDNQTRGPNVYSILTGTGRVSFGDVTTVMGNPVLTALVGTTSAIGGSALTLGQQATGTVVIAGATAAVAAGATIQATPVTADAPGDGFIWTANLTSTTDTVEVKVVCLVAGTPTSSTYEVKVF